jgi:hypothetical protein
VPYRRALSFTCDDLAHALFTTGRAPGDQASYGSASVFEALHRCSLIPAYVRRDAAGALVRSRLALELDRSEKSALSYAVGQAMTSIFCRQALGVTHLLHVDRYAKHHIITFGTGKTRADLFGPSPRGWVVAEAKGRSNNSDAELVRKLRSQKRSVRSIRGAAPWIALGCVACFPDPNYRSLRALTWDPEETKAAAIDLEITLDGYFQAYYSPFLAALSAGDATDLMDPAYIATRFPGLDLTVGLRRDLYEAMTGERGSVARIALGSMYPAYASDVDTRDYREEAAPKDLEAQDGEPMDSELSRTAGTQGPTETVFPDGTLFATNWSSAITTRDWEA